MWPIWYGEAPRKIRRGVEWMPAASEWARLDTSDSSRRATRSRQPADSVSLVGQGQVREATASYEKLASVFSRELYRKGSDSGLPCRWGFGALGDSNATRFGGERMLAKWTFTESMRVVVSQPR